ncbi:Ribosomal RNA-processing protein 15 [Yarrowia sp. C11]|nr:Ribosomal RNA-processing protein 15 [Yarrowia sp. E02]KAG5371700.1 Ribosomal RNA-processing protein 15 [Yarrowia sp. C11]
MGQKSGAKGKVTISVEKKDGSKAVTKPVSKKQVTKQVEQEADSSEEEDLEELEGGDGEDDEEHDDDESDDDSEDDSEDDSMMEDEFDIDEEESDDEEGMDASALHKAKKAKKDEAFGKAFSAILGSSIKAHAKENPILIRSTKSAKELEDQKLEAKARRLIKLEKRKAAEKDRVKTLVPFDDPERAKEVLANEKKLKKVAQRGAIRMFNAILAAQTGAKSLDETSVLGAKKRDEMASQMSKESFLDAVREG